MEGKGRRCVPAAEELGMMLTEEQMCVPISALSQSVLGAILLQLMSYHLRKTYVPGVGTEL